MAAPKPSTKHKKKAGPTKGERMTRGKTAAIQAGRERTAAQTAPGTDYKAEQAAKKKAGGGVRLTGRESAASKAEKRRKRLAKMKEITGQARELRKKRSPMVTGL